MTIEPDSARRPARYYLDDLAVGDRFASGSHTISDGEIREFAGRFDPQPFHMDEHLAKGTFFGGLAASGWLVAALTMRLLVDGGLPLGGGIIGIEACVKWPRPTRPGDVLRVESEILEISPSRSRPDRGIVSARSRTLNQENVEVQSMVTKLMVFRRGGAVT